MSRLSEDYAAEHDGIHASFRDDAPVLCEQGLFQRKDTHVQASLRGLAPAIDSIFGR